jgi:hypothetical protein
MTAVDTTIFEDAGRAIMKRKSLSTVVFQSRFGLLFGVTPDLSSELWTLLSSETTMDSYAKPKHLLWALMLMKIYATEAVLSVLAGCDEKTFRKWAWTFIEEMSNLSESVVSASVGVLLQPQFY